MSLKIVLKGLEHTESIDNMIKRKCEKIFKHLDNDAVINWTCKSEHHQKISEVHVTHASKDFHTKVTDKDLYKTFDEAVLKIISQTEHSKH